ncbi:hypothetical protein GCM10027074_06700 [Streptomyces deserti]
MLAGLDNFTIGTTQRLVNQLVNAELRQRTTAFTKPVESLAEQAVLRAPSDEELRRTGLRRGEVTVQLMFDPPEHVRLPINDDEIVDRALAIKPLSGAR